MVIVVFKLHSLFWVLVYVVHEKEHKEQRRVFRIFKNEP